MKNQGFQTTCPRPISICYELLPQHPSPTLESCSIQRLQGNMAHSTTASGPSGLSYQGRKSRFFRLFIGKREWGGRTGGFELVTLRSHVQPCMPSK